VQITILQIYIYDKSHFTPSHACMLACDRCSTPDWDACAKTAHARNAPARKITAEGKAERTRTTPPSHKLVRNARPQDCCHERHVGDRLWEQAGRDLVLTTRACAAHETHAFVVKSSLSFCGELARRRDIRFRTYAWARPFSRAQNPAKR
jgi:hypothetical protein